MTDQQVSKEPTEWNFNEAFSFTDEDAAAAASNPTLPDGLYLLKATETPKRRTSDSPNGFGNMQLVVKWAPVRDPSNFDSVAKNFGLQQYLTLPFSNPDVPGHVAPKWAIKQWHDVLSAVYADVIPKPYKPKDGPKGQYLYQGRTIGSKEYEAAMIEALKSAAPYVRKIAADPSEVMKWAVYADVVTKASKGSDKEFTNINRCYREIPTGGSLAVF